MYHPASPRHHERWDFYGAARHMPPAVGAVAAGVLAGTGAVLAPGIGALGAVVLGVRRAGIEITAP